MLGDTIYVSEYEWDSGEVWLLIKIKIEMRVWWE